MNSGLHPNTPQQTPVRNCSLKRSRGPTPTTLRLTLQIRSCSLTVNRPPSFKSRFKNNACLYLGNKTGLNPCIWRNLCLVMHHCCYSTNVAAHPYTFSCTAPIKRQHHHRKVEQAPFQISRYTSAVPVWFLHTDQTSIWSHSVCEVKCFVENHIWTQSCCCRVPQNTAAL